MTAFTENVELDARMVLAAMRGGFHEAMGVAFAAGAPSPDDAAARIAWLKKQPDEYILRVSKRTQELMEELNE